MDTPLSLRPSPQPSPKSGEGADSVNAPTRAQFLVTGNAALAAIEDLLRQARKSVRLEMYIFRADSAGDRIRAALIDACKRGVGVRVLLDDFGSAQLPPNYFAEFTQQGGVLRTFNPSPMLRVAFRNHRKLCVVDDDAIVGGFNIGDEYAGDGVATGWRDLGLRVNGPLVDELARSFDRMFIAARMDSKSFLLFVRGSQKRLPPLDRAALLTSGPAFGGASMRKTLFRDLERATQVDIVTAYFAPTWTLRRRLLASTNRRAIRLVLPGKSDVTVLRLAAQHLYSRLLRRGVKVYEYQPQVLHTKLLVLDDVVYVGSCNLDTRSLRINFELLLRIPDAALAQEARQLIDGDITHSQLIDAGQWERSNNWWRKLVRQFAYWLAIRFDLILVRRKLRAMR